MKKEVEFQDRFSEAWDATKLLGLKTKWITFMLDNNAYSAILWNEILGSVQRLFKMYDFVLWDRN